VAANTSRDIFVVIPRPSLLCRYIPFVGSPSEKMFNFMNFIADFFPVFIGNRKNGGVGNAVYINSSPCFTVKCIKICYPPGRHSKLKDKHFHAVIKIKSFQTAFQNEIFMIYEITFRDQTLPFF
jgi:hypothetical protein